MLKSVFFPGRYGVPVALILGYGVFTLAVPSGEAGPAIRLDSEPAFTAEVAPIALVQDEIEVSDAVRPTAISQDAIALKP